MMSDRDADRLLQYITADEINALCQDIAERRDAVISLARPCSDLREPGQPLMLMGKA